MVGRSRFFRCAALAIMLLAGSEIVFCAQCSPESCLFSHDHQKSGDSSQSGDDCLCCCTHIVVIQRIGVASPVAAVVSVPLLIVPPLVFPPFPAVYHPPHA
jgi:hypothetical protein